MKQIRYKAGKTTDRQTPVHFNLQLPLCLWNKIYTIILFLYWKQLL